MIKTAILHLRNQHPMFIFCVVVGMVSGSLLMLAGVPSIFVAGLAGILIWFTTLVAADTQRWIVMVAAWVLQREPVELIHFTGSGKFFTLCYASGDLEDTRCAPVYWTTNTDKVFLNPDGTISDNAAWLKNHSNFTHWLPARKQDRVAHVLTYEDFKVK